MIVLITLKKWTNTTNIRMEMCYYLDSAEQGLSVQGRILIPVAILKEDETMSNLSGIERKIQILLIQIGTIFLQLFFSIFTSMFFISSFFTVLLLVILSYITRWFIYLPRDKGLNKHRTGSAHIFTGMVKCERLVFWSGLKGYWA